MVTWWSPPPRPGRCLPAIVEYLPQSGVQKLEDATLVVAIAINFAILITAAQQGSLFWTSRLTYLGAWKASKVAQGH